MKRTLLITLLAAALPLIAFGGRPAYALFDNAKNDACQGVALGDPNPPACDQTAGVKVNSLITVAINGLSIIVGVAAVIMIIVGGLKYITSSGDSASTNSAKNTVLYAIVGLIIVALAQIIVRVVVHRSSDLPPCPPGASQLPNGTACKTS